MLGWLRRLFDHSGRHGFVEHRRFMVKLARLMGTDCARRAWDYDLYESPPLGLSRTEWNALVDDVIVRANSDR